MKRPTEWREGDFPIGIEVRQENGWDHNYVVYRNTERLSEFLDYGAAAAFAHRTDLHPPSLLPEDGSIPSFLLCKNPEVAKAREEYHSKPMPPALAAVTIEKPKETDADLAAYLAGEAERERIAKENALAKLNGKKAIETKTIQGGYFDSGRNQWITPEQDFAEMAARVTPHKREMTTAELRAVFEEAAKLPFAWKTNPKTGVAEHAECCAMFAKRILSQLDGAKLALEEKKALDRAKRRAAYAKKHGKTVVVSTRRKKAA